MQYLKRHLQCRGGGIKIYISKETFTSVDISITVYAYTVSFFLEVYMFLVDLITGNILVTDFYLV